MTDAAAPRSTFVTILAWLCIAFFAFGTLIGVLQNAMLYFLMGGMPPIPEDQLQQVPPLMRWMFGNFKLIFFSALLFMAFMLVASISLLKRQNWARLAFIVVLGLGILWSVFGIYFISVVMDEMPQPPEVRQFETIVTIITVIFSLIFSVLHGWILWKLTTPDIRREFVSQ
jgi:hypothetical protein